MRVWPGRAAPLGASLDATGCNIAVATGDAVDRVEVCFERRDGSVECVDLPQRSGAVWHGEFPDLGAGVRYGFRTHGVRSHPGEVWNPSKLLMDPYARAIDGDVVAHPALADNGFDSAPYVPRSVVHRDDFDWEGDRPPAVAWNDTLIYEAHVRGLTIRHPDVPPALRGTYVALGSPPIVEHLRSLGVTAVELLPVHQFVTEPRLAALGLTNYWGYNSIGYFAPHNGYATRPGDGRLAVAEFKAMVRTLHRAGIEVILDVVYNHTAEGDMAGPILSFRGLDNSGYYRLDPDDPADYLDFTGCGNSVDARQPTALRLIMDSLRYWIDEMHVDGFRFDLAATLAREPDEVNRFSAFLRVIQQDPVVSRVKLIAEPWDVGLGGFQVGNFPPPWSEWNSHYRDTVRDFWRGAGGTLADLAQRMCGSADLFDTAGRAPRSSINFVTAHDGFTLSDLVSYEHKRNEANGESNRDGTDDNRSWNCGVEGPSDDPDVAGLRAQQRRNLMATLLLSQGVPMVLAGDELGNTQRGMNNAYAQDNEITWLDWDALDEEMLAFCRKLNAFRAAHPVLRRQRFLRGRPTGTSQCADAAWLDVDGTPMAADRWNHGNAPVVGLLLAGDAIDETGPRGEAVVDDTLFVIVNGGAEMVPFVLPDHAVSSRWIVALDTASGMVATLDEARSVGPQLPGGEKVDVAGRSIRVFVANR